MRKNTFIIIPENKLKPFTKKYITDLAKHI